MAVGSRFATTPAITTTRLPTASRPKVEAQFAIAFAGGVCPEGILIQNRSPERPSARHFQLRIVFCPWHERGRDYRPAKTKALKVISRTSIIWATNRLSLIQENSQVYPQAPNYARPKAVWRCCSPLVSSSA